ncbi:hypothetical protein [Pelagibacterium sp. H642]|uniref:hypothetical protein n=1 Tax=Pelagibacterium sp. H642 TaxID=1881069 RepID=UPI002815BA22|nr:hypothetical protein [Pelagibacterium sp. H642]WMT90136.1 hypothetical protein NO934_15260 [Pelagibacterium sp. H642]
MNKPAHDWTDFPDERVFGGAGEQPGSQASYWRETEIKRRLYLLQKRALEEQVKATATQQKAIEAQREATKAQNAAVAEMRHQSKIMFWSVIGIFATAVVTLIAAFIS